MSMPINPFSKSTLIAPSTTATPFSAQPQTASMGTTNNPGAPSGYVGSAGQYSMSSPAAQPTAQQLNWGNLGEAPPVAQPWNNFTQAPQQIMGSSWPEQSQIAQPAPEQPLNFAQPQQQSVSQQAYANMMGGGFYGGILPHGSFGMTPIKAPNPPAQSAVQNQMSFGSSPWPGVWGS